MLRGFIKNKGGNVALLTAIFAVPLFGGVSVAVDYARLYRIGSVLQNTADAAALASAKDPALATAKDDVIEGVVVNYVKSILFNKLGLDHGGNSVDIATTISKSRKDVSVSLAYVWKPMLLQYLNAKALPVEVSATASLVGSEKICVITLNKGKSDTFFMKESSSLSANGCAVYSNSTSPTGINLAASADLITSNTYTAGGFGGPVSSYRPSPIQDSPVIADPLKDRAPPAARFCDSRKVKRVAKITRLKPGIYCGGIALKQTAELILEPGVYVMKNGPLRIMGETTIIGENVGFYFTGGGGFHFGPKTKVRLTAPKTGPLAGLLFYQDRNDKNGRTFKILSRDAKKFEGTVYLPRGHLIVENESEIGTESKWTAIVANTIEIRDGSKVELKSDYAASDIPVPQGISTNTKIRLIK